MHGYSNPFHSMAAQGGASKTESADPLIREDELQLPPITVSKTTTTIARRRVVIAILSAIVVLLLFASICLAVAFATSKIDQVSDRSSEEKGSAGASHERLVGKHEEEESYEVRMFDKMPGPLSKPRDRSGLRYDDLDDASYESFSSSSSEEEDDIEAELWERYEDLFPEEGDVITPDDLPEWFHGGLDEAFEYDDVEYEIYDYADEYDYSSEEDSSSEEYYYDYDDDWELPDDSEVDYVDYVDYDFDYDDDDYEDEDEDEDASFLQSWLNYENDDVMDAGDVNGYQWLDEWDEEAAFDQYTAAFDEEK